MADCVTYDDFLHSKVIIAPESGFDVEPSEVSQTLKPHQRDAVGYLRDYEDTSCQTMSMFDLEEGDTT